LGLRLHQPTGHPAQLLRAWRNESFQIVVSPPLIAELADVLTRPRIIRKYPIRAEDVETFLQLLGVRATLVTPTGTLHECRDPDDDLMLETALLAQVEYLVTRDDDIKSDQDLVARLHSHNVSVVSVQQFLNVLAPKRDR